MESRPSIIQSALPPSFFFYQKLSNFKIIFSLISTSSQKKTKLIKWASVCVCVCVCVCVYVCVYVCVCMCVSVSVR